VGKDFNAPFKLFYLALRNKLIRNQMSKTKIFVGKIPKESKSSDLEDAFTKFGKINNVEMRNGFAFVVTIPPII
jgi:RNA recognition motif-containing protein